MRRAYRNMTSGSRIWLETNRRNDVPPGMMKGLERAGSSSLKGSQSPGGSAEYASEIPWVAKNSRYMNAYYVSGEDPWEFCLKYQNDDRQLLKIEKEIRDQHSKGLLKKCLPAVGKFVVGHMGGDKAEYFRGVVTKFNAKAKMNVRCVQVYQVDTGHKVALFQDDVYEVPESVASIRACVVNCRMLDPEPRLRDKFCPELRQIFKEALEGSVITVALDKPDDSFPPRFAADVFIYNPDKLFGDVNFNQWLVSKVVPRLRQVPPAFGDVWFFFHEPELKDPFYEERMKFQAYYDSPASPKGAENVVQGTAVQRSAGLPSESLQPGKDSSSRQRGPRNFKTRLSPAYRCLPAGAKKSLRHQSILELDETLEPEFERCFARARESGDKKGFCTFVADVKEKCHP